MPGIVGLSTRLPKSRAISLLMQMVKSISHEAFYVSGTWCDEDSSTYVGWAVRNDSPGSHMPYRNETGDLVLLYSGEEYPDPHAIQGLKSRGHNFDAADASYLVHCCEEDPTFPYGLNGRFHGVLADVPQGTVLLFNDRFGMERLYFHQASDTFFFACEAKAILAVCPELRQPDWQSIGEFVSCGAVLENRTIFQGIDVLPPASAWTIRAGAVEKRQTYFTPKEWESQAPLEPEQYYRALQDCFTRNLPRYFEGAQHIAMSLTAGLDTRMIMACANAPTGALPCYTFGSMFRENFDVRSARRVAETCGQHFEVITPGTEFLREFSKYARRTVFLTDGCVDVGRAPDLYLNGLGRQIAAVRMTGLYGGEILRGVRAFKPVVPSHNIFCKELQTSIQNASKTYDRLLDCHPVSFAAFRQNPWYLFGSLSLEQTQVQVRTPFLDNQFLQTVFRSPAEERRSNKASWHLVAEGDARLKDIPTDRGLTANNSASDLLRYYVLEFLFKAEYAYDMGMPQWLARLDNCFSGLHLERLFLGRHKPFHFRVWYRDALGEYVRQMLLDSRSLTRPHVARRGVEEVVKGHLEGNRNFTVELHKLLSLELIHRIFFDPVPES